MLFTAFSPAGYNLNNYINTNIYYLSAKQEKQMGIINGKAAIVRKAAVGYWHLALSQKTQRTSTPTKHP